MGGCGICREFSDSGEQVGGTERGLGPSSHPLCFACSQLHCGMMTLGKLRVVVIGEGQPGYARLTTLLPAPSPLRPPWCSRHPAVSGAPGSIPRRLDGLPVHSSMYRDLSPPASSQEVCLLTAPPPSTPSPFPTAAGTPSATHMGRSWECQALKGEGRCRKEQGPCAGRAARPSWLGGIYQCSPPPGPTCSRG